MPPRKTKTGLEALIGKIILVESVYDKDRLEGILRSVDCHFLGIEVEGKVYYFNTSCLHGVTEKGPDIEPI